MKIKKHLEIIEKEREKLEAKRVLLVDDNYFNIDVLK